LGLVLVYVVIKELATPSISPRIRHTYFYGSRCINNRKKHSTLQDTEESYLFSRVCVPWPSGSCVFHFLFKLVSFRPDGFFHLYLSYTDDTEPFCLRIYDNMMMTSFKFGT